MRTEFYPRNTKPTVGNLVESNQVNEKARNLQIISFAYSQKENKLVAHDVTKT